MNHKKSIHSVKLIDGSKLEFLIYRHEFIISLNTDVLKRFKASKVTLQEGYSVFKEYIRHYQTQNKLLSESGVDGLGYVSLKLEKKCAKKLYSLLTELNIDNLIPLDSLHSTLVFDERNTQIKFNELERDSIISGHFVDAKILGNEHTFFYALVLEFKSDDYLKRFYELKEMGFHHDHDDIIPHISVKYYRKDQKQVAEDELILLKKHLNNIQNGVNKIDLKTERWQKAFS